MGLFITDEDVYKASRDFLLFRWWWFKKTKLKGKILTLLLLPLSYPLAFLIFLIFLFGWRLRNG